jgi:subtilase family serine protease
MKKIVFRYSISLIVFLFFFTVIASSANGQQVLKGHIPSVISDMGLKPISSLDSTMQLNIGIGLPLRNQAELRNMLQDIYNPASPNYRHYLSVAEFTAEFGATSQDCQAIVEFAKANNLTVTNIFKNNLLIDLQGKEADIERALHIKLLVYNHPTEKRTFFAPDRDPSVDLSGQSYKLAA